MPPDNALIDTEWKQPTAVQVHVVLDYLEPPIWRRLIVPLRTTLAELHHVIQASMGWTSSHLHEFQIGGLGMVTLICSTTI